MVQENKTPIYHDYAPFYDGSGHVRFSILMAQYLQEVLVQHPVAGHCALDLACGTGTLALILADQGWDVVGLDRAEAMLCVARAKAGNLDACGRVQFVQGDMRCVVADELSSDVHPSSFDLVTCMYDSLNYLLTEDDLAACFVGVAHVLRPGGLFVADMNTRHFLEHDSDACEIIEQDDFVQVAQNSFASTTGISTMRLTWFAGNDDGCYERFDETHLERAYPRDTVERLLGAAGLVVEAIYDCFTFESPNDRSQRLCWAARKRMKNEE